MRKRFSKKDRAIREAFRIYDASRAQWEETEKRRGGSSSGEGYIDGFEENKMEERICSLIEKLPIRNPRKKAGKIWAGCVAAVALCVLAECAVHYMREKPARVTTALQEVYSASGKRAKEKPAQVTTALQEAYGASGESMTEEQGDHLLVTADGWVYQCYTLNEREQNRLTEKGVVLKKSEEKVCGDFSRAHSDSSQARGDFSQALQVYRISGRKSRQFILVEDSAGQTFLGKFIAYKYWWGESYAEDTADGEERQKGDSEDAAGGQERQKSASEDAAGGQERQKGAGENIAGGEERQESQLANCGSLKDILENIMGIGSADDIRSVTLERSRAQTKDDPEKRVAIWTKEEDREWFYRFLSGEHKIWSPSPGGAAAEEEVRQVVEEGMPVTYGKKLYRWQSQVLQEIPDQAFYLQIENRLHETFLLGLVLEGDSAELWLEPLEEWGGQDTADMEQESNRKTTNTEQEEQKSSRKTADTAADSELAQADQRNGVICLSKQDQKKLSEVMWSVLEQ